MDNRRGGCGVPGKHIYLRNGSLTGGKRDEGPDDLISMSIEQ